MKLLLYLEILIVNGLDKFNKMIMDGIKWVIMIGKKNIMENGEIKVVMMAGVIKEETKQMMDGDSNIGTIMDGKIIIITMDGKITEEIITDGEMDGDLSQTLI